MKQLLFSLLAMAALSAHGAQQSLDLGAAGTGVGGDTVPEAFTKIEANFDELYPILSGALTKTITLGGNFTHTGAHTLGLTTTANTSITLPTTGTLATLAGTETLSNKTFTGTIPFDTITVTTLNATNFATINGADPATDAAGEIAVDTDDLFLEFYDGTASRVVGAVQTASVTIYDPDGIQAVSDALPILAVEATWAPHGITVRDVYLKTDASSTYSVDLEEWTAMLSPTVTSIEVVATSSSAEAEDDGTLADASVAAGSIVFVDLPATTANFITVSFTYTINPGN